MEIYLSTSNTSIDVNKIVCTLANLNIDAMVTSNLSSHCGAVEQGFVIRFFRLTGRDFRDRVWYPLLKPLGDFECAFVKVFGGYHGCILEWPDVFRDSICPSVAKRNAKNMRIAYCIFGDSLYYDGYGYDTVSDKLLAKYDVDVFFHCWYTEENEEKDEQLKNAIVKQYRPKNYKFESINIDDDEYTHRDMYSQKEVASLKRKYEEELGLNYDLVIMSKFNVCIGVLENISQVDSNVFTSLNDVMSITNSSNFDRVYFGMYENRMELTQLEKETKYFSICRHQVSQKCKLKFHESRNSYVQLINGLDKPSWIDNKIWMYSPECFDS